MHINLPHEANKCVYIFIFIMGKISKHIWVYIIELYAKKLYIYDSDMEQTEIYIYIHVSAAYISNTFGHKHV